LLQDYCKREVEVNKLHYQRFGAEISF